MSSPVLKMGETMRETTGMLAVSCLVPTLKFKFGECVSCLGFYRFWPLMFFCLSEYQKVGSTVER